MQNINPENCKVIISYQLWEIRVGPDFSKRVKVGVGSHGALPMTKGEVFTFGAVVILDDDTWAIDKSTAGSMTINTNGTS